VSQKPRYLTKSAFRTASECPTKLSYLKKREYFSTKQDNEFLRALANGGFQVGELAKLYHPGGIQIDALDYQDALQRTNDLLKNPEVIIYEAAFLFENYFIRADILVKSGNLINLIEVKAKSADNTKNDQFWTKNRKSLDSKWEPYLLDIAFQKWVVAKAKPNFIISPYLMLSDKAALSEVEGMNQRFLIISNPADSNLRIKVAPGTTADTLGKPVLTKIQVESEVDHILAQDYNGRNFASHVQYLSDHYSQDKRISPKLSRECRSCEYRISEEKIAEGLKSGFKQCWAEEGKLSPSDFNRPLVLDIWKLHYTKKDSFLKERRYFMDLLDSEDLEPKTKKKEVEIEPGLTNTARQLLQVTLAQKKTAKPYLDLDGISTMLEEFTYPLHFIDFETTRTAIPLYRGRRPYEQIAFQFSHHMIHKDGRIEHKDQYLSFERGKFPNFDFVRSLKKALEIDQGTIFRYADHENTVLREIHAQLRSEPSPPDDAEALCTWIDTITREKTSDKSYREGSRCMVDLKWLVQKFFYHPATQGSNSIKFVLPAILGESKFLQHKYSQPVYGSHESIPSLNFKDRVWITFKPDGSVSDPYKTLEPIFTDLEIPEESLYEDDDRIAEGGAAMTAYGRMQFTEMSEPERERVAAALLRYCELDTFAMVLIYEYWKDEIELRNKVTSKSQNKVA